MGNMGEARSHRKDKTLKLDGVAEEYYHEYWDNAQVVDAEKSYNEAESFHGQEELNIGQALELLGADKIVIVDDDHPRVVLLAQRFRSYDNGDDFSLRIKTWGGYSAEYQKYHNGIQEQGAYPNVYAFGNKNEAEDGFENFYLIDFQWFLHMDRMNRIRGRSPENYDGTQARYYKIEDLKRKNCILESWE